MGASSARKRPAPGSATGRVWEIADEMWRTGGALPSGRAVADVYVSEGGNEGTAFTQYSYWKKATLARREAPAGEGRPVQLRVDAAGRLEIPPDLLAAMQLGEDGRVTARVDGGELRLIAPRAALRRLRTAARELAPDGWTVVDSFIAEKRREAELE